MIEINSFENDRKTLEIIKDYWYEEWSEKSMSGKIQSLEDKETNERLPLLFVAKHNGNVIGTAGLFRHDLRNDISPWLGGVYVVKDFSQSDSEDSQRGTQMR